MTNVRAGFLLAIILLFLGWLPKLEADRVPWYLDNDFAHYYLTAKLAASGINPYSADLKPLYSQNGFLPSRELSSAGATPTVAVLMTPLTFFDAKNAFVIWTIFQISALCIGILLLLRALGITHSWIYSLILLVSAIAPLGTFAHIRYGQTQALIFLLTMLGMLLLSKKDGMQWKLGALLWGVSVSLKLFTAPLAFVALRYRGKGGLLWFMLGFALLWIPFALLCGVESLVTFITKILPYTQGLSLSFNGNISLSAAFVYTQRILFDHTYVQVIFVQIICALLLFPFLWIEFRERRDLFASTMLVLGVSCLLSPTAWTHYLPLLTGGFLYLLKGGLTSRDSSKALFALLFLYLCSGVALGYLSHGDILTQLISAWWGPACIITYMVLLFISRRRTGWFQPSDM